MGLADALQWDSPKRGGDPAPGSVSFTPAEQAEGDAQDRSASSVADLRTAISNERRPEVRKLLQGELDRVQPANGPFSGALDWQDSAKDAQAVPASAPVPKAPTQSFKQEFPQEANGSTLGEKIIGTGEGLLSMASGAIAAPLGAAAGLFKGLTGGKYGTKQGVAENNAMAKEVMNSLTYQPQTEVGRNIVSTVGDVLDSSKLAGMGPTEGIALSSVMAGARPAARVSGAKPPAGSAGPRAMASGDSAGTQPVEMARASVAGASPELKAAVEETIKKKIPINQAALDRHVEADSLPVRVPLTEGQARQDVGLLSKEQNARGSNAALRDRFNDQNTRLIDNTNAIRENAAPDVYATSIPEHGEMLIESYLNKDAKLNADISAKYKALTDANGGNFPLDSKAFVKSADAALHKDLLYDHVPPTIRKTLDRVSQDGMTFENFESLRTNLARIQRSVSADGNERAAAGVIRDALENLPMPEGAGHLKPLADEARAAAKARFDLLKSDPAYKAVVTGKAKADQFIQKYVVGAEKKDLAKLGENLADDPAARQVMASGVVNYLKAKAGIIQDTGNFSQAGYNKALEGIRPKLSLIFNPEEIKHIETLGKVARYTQAQPRGSFVNNSNTATSLMAEGARNAAEGVLSAKGVPVGTIKKLLNNRAEKKAMEQTLQPGAGIRLKDMVK